MSRIIIDNQSDREDVFAVELVQNVLRAGKISNDGKQHCYLTSFETKPGDYRYLVATVLNRKSERFIVYHEPHF